MNNSNLPDTTNTADLNPASRRWRRLIRPCVLALATGLGASAVLAANIQKADNSGALNAGTSWLGGTPPGPNDIAVWDTTVTANNTTNSLGASTNWQGIKIGNPASAVQINADGNTLTNGNGNVVGNVGIDMSAATQNVTLSNNFVVSGVQNWNIDSQTLTFGGNITRNAGGVIRLYGSGGSTPNVFLTNGSAVVSTTASPNALLGSTYGNIFFSTLNDVDFVGEIASGSGLQIVPGATTGVYTANTTGNGDPGSCNLLDVSTAGAFGQRLSSTRTYNGIRFNAPQLSTPAILGVFAFNNLNYWMINIPSGRVLTCNAILVTTNVGNSPVVICNGGISGSTLGSFRIGSGGTQDLLICQNNPLQPLIFLNNVTISQQGTGNLVKMGAGAVQIQTNSGYTGGTKVYEGTLEIDGLGTAGVGALNVFGGMFASSSASTNPAPTTVFAAATNRIVENSANAFSLYTSNLTLRAGSHFQVACSNTIAPSTTIPALIVTNPTTTLTVSNSVTVDILTGALSVGQYPLIKYGTIAGDGGGAFVLGTIEPHASGFISNNVANSSIDLVITSVTQPIKWAVGNNTWTIGGANNWVDSLLAPTTYQQNAASGDNVVFDDSASGTSPITVSLNATVSPGSVTFNNNAKTYTLTGNGSVNGLGSVTVSGSGTVNLQTTNAFSGGMNINGGVVNFVTLSNLGAGNINFGGGTLQYAPGTVDDISVDPVNFNAGNGTIDVNGNPVVLAHPVGNGGAGGFTLTNGNLQINGTNRYSGNTIVGHGSTLTLQSINTYISNSAALVVNGTLDASIAPNANGFGLVLNSLNSQKLAGSGTVLGEISTSTGTTISPGTNGTVGTLTVGGDLTINGGTIAMDINGPTGASRDQLAVTTTAGIGNLTLNGGLNSGALQLNVSGTLNNGIYPLITYQGTLIGGVGNLVLSGFNQSGSLAYLSSTGPNNGSIELNVIAGATNSLLWNGLINGVWDNASTANWTSNGVTGQIFQNGDKVTLDDTGATANVTLGAAGVAGSGTLLPGSMLINATNNNYTFQDGVGDGSGVFLGPMSLTITSGVANVTTLLTPNGNTGPTTIVGGTLQVGNGSTTGDIGTGNVTNNGTLIFDQIDNRSVSGQIVGTGKVIQEGTANLIFLANNSYAGQTIISNSTSSLQVGVGGALGTLGAGSVIDNGTLFVDRSGTVALPGITGSGSVLLSGGAAYTFGNASWQGNTFLTNGSLKLGAANQIPNVITVPGSTGNFGLAGSLDLSGFNQAVNGLTDLGLTNGIITNSAAAGVTNIITIGLNAPSNTLTYSGLIVDNTNRAGIGLVINNPGNINLSGASTYRGNTLVGGGATLTLGGAGTAGLPGNTACGTGSITMSNGTTLFINGNVTTFVGNPLILAPASTVLMEMQALGNGYNGPISGDAASTLAIPNIGTGVSFNGANIQQLNGFFGTVLLTNACTLRFSSTTGLNEGGSNVTVDVEGNGQMQCRNAGTVTVGALIGTGFIDGPTTGGTATYIIGEKNVPDTFLGQFTGNNNLVKDGSSVLTMSGSISNGFATNGLTYVGSTTVSNGTLQIIAPSNLNGTNFTPINLASQSAVLDISSAGFTPDNTNILTNSTLELGSGQTLTGIGSIYGSLIASNGSTVAVAFQPDTNRETLTGTLTITTNAEFAGNIQLNLCRTNTPNAGEIISPTITINPSATLVVTNVGPPLQNGDTFQLFNHPVSGFASITLPAINPSTSNNYVWTTNLAVNGSIQLTGGGSSAIASNPTNMTFSVSNGTNLSITWPGDHLGWSLQSNSVSLTVTSQWFTIPGSAAVTNESLIIDRTRSNVFFRMVLP